MVEFRSIIYPNASLNDILLANAESFKVDKTDLHLYRLPDMLEIDLSDTTVQALAAFKTSTRIKVLRSKDVARSSSALLARFDSGYQTDDCLKQMMDLAPAKVANGAVDSKLVQAFEEFPEAFIPVHMLILPVYVNGHRMRALVDCGASMTFIFKKAFERAGLEAMLDRRFEGMIHGIEAMPGLGHVHAAALQVGGSIVEHPFLVVDGSSSIQDFDMILGLDYMLRYKARLDLKKLQFVFDGGVVPFMTEVELARANARAVPFLLPSEIRGKGMGVKASSH